jgi:NTP pyrophosphatase (non-canonical NTP hydrolase)
MIDRQEMLLIQLMEEAGEVVQAASKVLRLDGIQKPNRVWRDYSNDPT